MTRYMLSTATIPSTIPGRPLAMIGSTAHAIIPFGSSPPLAKVPGGVPLSSRFFSLVRCAAISLSDLRVYTFGSIPPAAGVRCVSCTIARTLAVAARAGMVNAPVVDADPTPAPHPLSSRSPPPLACWFHAKCISSDIRPRTPCSVLNAFWPRSTSAMCPSTRSNAPASKLTARTVTVKRCSADRAPSASMDARWGEEGVETPRISAPYVGSHSCMRGNAPTSGRSPGPLFRSFFASSSSSSSSSSDRDSPVDGGALDAPVSLDGSSVASMGTSSSFDGA